VRSPARFDPVQLAMWQKQAVHALSPAQALEWLSAYLPAGLDQPIARDFVAAIQPNVVLPGEVAHWASVVFGDLPLPDADTAAKLVAAAPVFAAAAEALRQHGTDWKAITTQVRERTGRKGPELFKPLRLALTGLDHGPEIAPLLGLMGAARALQRLERLA